MRDGIVVRPSISTRLQTAGHQIILRLKAKTKVRGRPNRLLRITLARHLSGLSRSQWPPLHSLSSQPVGLRRGLSVSRAGLPAPCKCCHALNFLHNDRYQGCDSGANHYARDPH